MRNSFVVSSLVAVVALSAACSKPASAPAAAAAPAASDQPSTKEELGQPSDPSFIGKIWVSTTPGHTRGSMLIFLPDRSLLMDSCFETYRISQWGAEGDRIRWIEDSIPIEATISLPSDKELRLQVAGQDRVQSYVIATVPYVCPDMPK